MYNLSFDPINNEYNETSSTYLSLSSIHTITWV